MTREPEARPRRSSVAAWLVYDTANTVFSFNILSAFFPVWLTKQGLPDSVFAIGNSLAMALMLLLSPALGAISDKARRRIPFLVASTVLCVAFTLPLGFVAWPTAVAFFVVANVGFQAGLIFYDALLAVVSTPANRGKVGSLGVAVGYLGSFLGLGLGSAILAGGEDRYAWVFVATATAFLLLALPAFFLVREPERPPSRLGPREVWKTIRASLAGVVRLARGHEDPRLARFLLGRVFYSDAVNTMIAFLGVYALNEAGLDDAGVRIALFIGILGAFLGAPFWGMLVDRNGAARTLMAVLGVWLVGLGLVIAVPVLDLAPPVFFAAAFILGNALGGTWSADRPLMLQLAPPARLGEFYGVYAMVGRFSAVAGPLVWALVVDVLDLGRPAAVATLALFILVAAAILWPLTRPQPTSPTTAS